jgi:RNA polymerase sigma factor (sigma-70 family)
VPAELEQAILASLDAAHNLARWLVRDAGAAEDVVQEAVLRALRYRASWRGGDARAWLLRITRNSAYAWLAARRDAAEVPLEDEAAPGPLAALRDPAPDPEAALAARQDDAGLAERLAALPPELRECLVLRELEELSYREIARITEVPVGTVMSRLWRARQALVGAPARRVKA